MRCMKKIVIILMAAVLFPICAFAEKGDLRYPELRVTPLASERLNIEVKKESESRFRGYELYLASALVTSLSGIYGLTDKSKNNSDNETANYLTIATGAAFAGIGSYLAFVSTPYHEASIPVKAMKTGTVYDRLVKERMSEERIDNIARFNRRLRIFTGIVQVGLSIALAATSEDEDDESTAVDESGANTTALYAAGLTFAAGVTNFIFTHPSERVSALQKSYKKKIYSYVVPSVFKDGAGFVAGIKF